MHQFHAMCIPAGRPHLRKFSTFRLGLVGSFRFISQSGNDKLQFNSPFASIRLLIRKEPRAISRVMLPFHAGAPDGESAGRAGRMGWGQGRGAGEIQRAPRMPLRAAGCVTRERMVAPGGHCAGSSSAGPDAACGPLCVGDWLRAAVARRASSCGELSLRQIAPRDHPMAATDGPPGPIAPEPPPMAPQ